MKRYFLVVYIASVRGKTGIVTGNINIETTDCFLNRKKVTSIIEDKNDKLDLYDVVFTGFFEMSENDYQDFIKQD